MKSARKLVAGPVMTRYVSFQVIEDEANEQAGQPGGAGSVTLTRGRFQICYPQDQRGGGCQSFTAFQADASGRITGMDVDGQPVASRLAAGPSDSGGGIRITDVTSYLSTFSGTIGVAFRIRNVSNHQVGQDGFLPVFVTSPGGTRLQLDFSNSSDTTQALAPGQVAAIVAVFDTRTFTGTLIVQSNGGYRTLVSSRLRKPVA